MLLALFVGIFASMGAALLIHVGKRIWFIFKEKSPHAKSNILTVLIWVSVFFITWIITSLGAAFLYCMFLIIEPIFQTYENVRLARILFILYCGLGILLNSSFIIAFKYLARPTPKELDAMIERRQNYLKKPANTPDTNELKEKGHPGSIADQQ